MISPYLELPVCGEVAAVEAGVELHPVPGHAPGPAPGPGPQLGVAEQSPPLTGHVVTTALQAAAWNKIIVTHLLCRYENLKSGFKWLESEQM